MWNTIYWNDSLSNSAKNFKFHMKQFDISLSKELHKKVIGLRNVTRLIYPLLNIPSLGWIERSDLYTGL